MIGENELKGKEFHTVMHNFLTKRKGPQPRASAADNIAYWNRHSCRGRYYWNKFCKICKQDPQQPLCDANLERQLGHNLSVEAKRLGFGFGIAIAAVILLIIICWCICRRLTQ